MSIGHAVQVEDHQSFWEFTLRCLGEGTKEFYEPLFAVKRWWVERQKIRRNLLDMDLAVLEIKAVAIQDSQRHSREMGELLKMVAELSEAHDRDKQMIYSAIEAANSKVLDSLEKQTKQPVSGLRRGPTFTLGQAKVDGRDVEITVVKDLRYAETNVQHIPPDPFVVPHKEHGKIRVLVDENGIPIELGESSKSMYVGAALVRGKTKK